jgi:MarR family transcriptional regulator, transcriptional regulator for hemolysin
MTEDARPAYVAFHDVARFRAQLFDRLIAPHGLTMSQAWVLAHLFVEDGLTQTEIARRMAVGTVTVGGLVDRLEASGLVERRTAPNDRRANCVYRTKAATKLGRVMNQCADQVNEVAFAGMSDEVVAQFMTSLNQVRDNLAGTEPQDMPTTAEKN